MDSIRNRDTGRGYIKKKIKQKKYSDKVWREPEGLVLLKIDDLKEPKSL